MLEEGSFFNRPADFFYMLLFGGTLMMSIAPFVHIDFLGFSLTFMMVYVWARRNENSRMNFFGIIYIYSSLPSLGSLILLSDVNRK